MLPLPVVCSSIACCMHAPEARYERMSGRALAPLAEHSKGGSLHSLIKLQKVLALTEAYEKRRGHLFQWLVYSRLDLAWVSNHPPLRLLDEQSIWTIPLGGTLQDQALPEAIDSWHANQSPCRSELSRECRIRRLSLQTTGMQWCHGHWPSLILNAGLWRPDKHSDATDR